MGCREGPDPHGAGGCAETIDIRDFAIPYRGDGSVDYAGKLKEVYFDTINENPDLFYLANTFSMSAAGYSEEDAVFVALTPAYAMSGDEIAEAKPVYEDSISVALAWADGLTSDLEKAKAIHDYLVLECAYNTAASETGYNAATGMDKFAWSAYGALVVEKPVCQGYALAYIACLRRLGISTEYISQTVGNSGHAWNRALVDGDWYNVDVTWDDPLRNGADQGFVTPTRSTYFMKSDAYWVNKHVSGSVAYTQTGTPAATNTAYDGRVDADWTTYTGPPVAVTPNEDWALSSSSIDMHVGGVHDITVHDAGDGVSAASAEWSSSNPDIVSVTNTGALLAGDTAGVATVTCALGSSTRTCTVRVHGGDMGSANAPVTVRVDESPVYNGVAQEPALVVTQTLGAGEAYALAAGTDYTAEYADNVNAGTATVTVTGAGVFSGAVSTTFEIAVRDAAGAWVSAIPKQIYKGEPLTPDVTVILDGVQLVAGTDYVVAYSNNTGEGTGSVTVTFQGNCTRNAPLTATFAIACNWDGGTVTTPATCTEDGVRTYICTDNPAITKTEPVTALGHDYDAVVTEPTCIEDGYTTHTCSRCGDSYVTDQKPALGHAYNAVVNEPTCTEGGYTTCTCSRCGNSYITDEKLALGHAWGEGVITTEPTCAEEGVRTFTCSRCGETKTEPAAALGHDYNAVVTEPTCTEGGYTTCTCPRCGDVCTVDETHALGHAWGEGTVTTEPTCTEEGVRTFTCSRCGETKTEPVAALGHALEHVKAVAATFASEGSIEYWRCGVCHRLFKDAEGTGEITAADTVVPVLAKLANTISVTASYTKVGNVGKAQSFVLRAGSTSGVLRFGSDTKSVTVSSSGRVTIAKNYTGLASITVSSPETSDHLAAKDKKITIKVKPGKMAVSKAANIKGKKIKVAWAKQAGADKYQVRVALNKKFTSGKKTYSATASASSKTTGKLSKGKTYYVQIRAYDSQTRAWGTWSTAKKVKVKK